MTFIIRNDEDIRQLEKELTSAYLAIRPTPVLQRAITDLQKLHAGYFESDVGPGGNRWAELAPSTVARKGHADILEDTLKMRRAVSSTGASGAIREVFDEGFQAGLVFGLDADEIPYWVYHDQGQGRMFRPFIGITDAELTVIGERLLRHQIKELRRAA